jgi:hypothetical protein
MITKDESSNENSTLGFIHQMSEFTTLWRVLTMTKTSEEVHLELCHPSELPSVSLPDRCSTYPNDSPQLQTRSESLRLHHCSTRERDLRGCTTCAGIAPRWVRTVGVGDDVCGSSRSTATRTHCRPLLLLISGPDRSLTHSRCPQGTGITYVDWDPVVFPWRKLPFLCGLGLIWMGLFFIMSEDPDGVISLKELELKW